MPESSPKPWNLAGNPLFCPRCGEFGVVWTVKPEAQPTTEAIDCPHCRYHLVRSFIPFESALMLSVPEINCVKQAVGYWINIAQRKSDRIRRKQAEVADSDGELSPSEEADVHYINTELPIRVNHMKAVLKKIEEHARERIPKPAD